MPEPPNSSEGWVYVFASLLEDRPKYRQEALNVLAKPPGLVHKLRYKTEWVATNTESSAALSGAWKGRTMAVIFTVYEDQASHSAPTFFPLRLGKIVDVEIQGNVLFLYFQIGSYFDYGLDGDKFNREIKRVLPGNRRPRSKFVSSGPRSDVLARASEGDPGVAWESTVDRLASVSGVQHQSFVRVTACRDLSSVSGKVLQAESILRNSRERGFRLRTGQQYALDFTFKVPNYEGELTRLKCLFNKSLVEPMDDEYIDIDTKYDTRTLRIFVKEAPTSRYSAAIVKAEEDTLSNAHITIPFELRTRSLVRAGLTVFFLAGVGALAASGSIEANVVSVPLGIGGAVLSSLTFFLLTGRIER